MNEWRWMLARGRPYLKWILAGIALSTIVILANVALLGLSGWFITAMAAAGLQGASINYFTPAAAIRGLAITRTIGRYLERLVTHESTFRLLAELRQWFFERLEPLAPARLQYLRGGDLLSRLRADIDTLENAYLRIVTPAAAALAASLVVLGFLAVISPAIAVTTLLALLTAGVLLPWLGARRCDAPGRAIRQVRSDLRARTAETVRGQAELAIYGGRDAQRRQIVQLNDDLLSPQRRRNRSETALSAAGALTAQAGWLAALLIGLWLFQQELVSGPLLVMLVLLVMAAFEAVAPLPLAWQSWGETRSAARRLMEIVDAEPAVTDPPREAPPPTRFDIRFDHVGLRYPGASEPALSDIDLTIPEGGRLAVVGPSGAGKTSLVHLLLRFWPYSAGEIRIGGQPIDRYRGETVRRWCSVVGQHAHLFNATIAENLRLACPEADDERLIEAARAAGIHDEIRRMPDGYDTAVGEAATRLSGGQIRRIAIARALLKDAPILILDEPTEGLDRGSEQAVIAALYRAMAGRTVLMITHRPALLALADRVARLEHGRLISEETRGSRTGRRQAG
jgi:ATP-binding cassette subfamily C protein CydC